MTDHIASSIRESYDELADVYARELYTELEHKPLDRQLLDRFASQIPGKGKVWDMGCGPGHVTRYLHSAGVEVSGLDLSPRMVEIARQLNPAILFSVANMMSLDLRDGQLAGICAFYAIVNTPKESLPLVFREMARVLQPGGAVLLAFHVGDEVIHLEELWGKHISLDFFFFRIEDIQQYLLSAGLEVEEIIKRSPYGPNVEHQSRRAYVFARKHQL
jgi:SAM-dependent methyltransferase